MPRPGAASVVVVVDEVRAGGGGAVSSFLAYNEARRWSRHKEEFGHGSPEGIAAPEAGPEPAPQRRHWSIPRRNAMATALVRSGASSLW